MDIETTEHRGTKRTAEDAGLAPKEQHRIRVRRNCLTAFNLDIANRRIRR